MHELEKIECALLFLNDDIVNKWRSWRRTFSNFVSLLKKKLSDILHKNLLNSKLNKIYWENFKSWDIWTFHWKFLMCIYDVIVSFQTLSSFHFIMKDKYETA